MKKKYTPHFLIIAILGLLLTTPIGPALADNATNLEITNLTGASYTFTYAQLLAMPKTVVNADLYCDGALATYGNWGGVRLSYLLTQAQATPEVESVHFIATDGYKVAIPMALAIQPQIILAYEKDGQPLSEGLRLIVPGANGAVWIALITSITMSSSGTDYPQAVSMGGGTVESLMPTQNSTNQTSPAPQQTGSVQPQPTKPQNSSSIQLTSPANVTHPYQPATTPQLSNESSSLQAVILPSTAFAFAIALITTAYVAHRRKRKHYK